LGDLLVQCNQTDSALVQYKAAVALNPEAYPIWKQLLLITYKEEQWDSLVRLSAECQALFPVQPMPYLTLAIAKNKIGQLDDAEQALDAGSELIVSNDPALVAEFSFQRGILALNRRQVTNATTWFNQAITLQPENLELKADIGNEALIYSELTSYADSLITECLAQEPSNPKFMAIKGRLFYIKNDLLLANSWLEKAIIHGYPKKLGEEWLGDCAFRAGNLKQAKYYWLNAVSLGNQTERLKQKIKSL
jgi:tetratricopeptide (TPR) repeat protein